MTDVDDGATAAVEAASPRAASATVSPAVATWSPPALGPRRRIVRELGLAMIVGGIIVLLFVVYQLFGTTLSEERAQSSLGRAFQSARLHGGVPAVAPVGEPAVAPAGGDAATVRAGGGATAADLSPSTPSGSAIEHLVIPRIGVDRYVVQGTTEQDLMQGPGHYIDTPFPGQKGNAAIAGHRTTYGAPFFRLDQLAAGDLIYVTNAKGTTFVYSVIRHLISAPDGPSATAVLADTPIAELTLTTCNPRFEATDRLVVVAVLVGRPVSAVVASPTAASPTATSPAATSPAVTSPTATSPTATSPTATSPAVTSESAASAAAARHVTGQTTATLGTGNSNGWGPGIAYGAAVVALWVATRLVVNRTQRWRRAGALLLGVAVCSGPLWLCFENVVRLLPQSI